MTHDKGGAVERRVLAVAKEQAALGHEVTIFSAGETATFDLGGVTVHGVPCRSRRPLRDYEYLFRVRAALRARKFDVIHSHGVPDAARVLRGSASGATFVISVDFFRYRLTRSTIGRRHYRNSLRMFGSICPVSQYCRDEFLRFYGEELAGLVSVVHNGVDTSQFYPDEVEAQRVAAAYRIPEESPYVMYLGRVNRQKGSDLLPSLAEGLKDVKVVVAGPIGQFGHAGSADMIDELRSAGGMYLGAVPNSDLRGLLSGATALMLPTRQDEMFGMVLVEAGACGTPAVASALGGIPEAMGEGGLLFSVGDVRELVDSTRRIVDDTSMRRTLSEAARRNSQRFAWQIIAKAYNDVYSR